MSHVAVADHGFGECDRGALVDVLTVDVFAMGETVPARILDTPCPALGGPFDFGAQLAPDSEVVDRSRELAVRGTPQPLRRLRASGEAKKPTHPGTIETSFMLSAESREKRIRWKCA